MFDHAEKFTQMAFGILMIAGALVTGAGMIQRGFQKPWFWPQDVRDEPGFINRLGRVFHWTWIIISAAILATGVIGGALHTWWLWFGPVDGPSGTEPAVAFICLGLSAVTWMIGRGVRYIFSGE